MFSRPVNFFKRSYKRIITRTSARLASVPNVRNTRLVLGALIGFVLVALMYLMQSSNAALVTRDLRVKQLRIEELERENAELRFEIAALTSPIAIEQRARKLGLGPAKRVVYANMPELHVAQAEVMPAFAPGTQSVSGDDWIVSAGSSWDDFLALIGLGNGGDQANAQTR